MDVWKEGVVRNLSRNTLWQLWKGEIPAIYLQNFISRESAKDLCQGFNRLVSGFYQGVTPRIRKIGPAAFEYPATERKNYFRQSALVREMLAENVRESAALLKRCQDLFRDSCQVETELACDPEHGQYFAGIFRSIEEGTPVHIDFAPFESPGWPVISELASQISANVYLENPQKSGGLSIFEKIWSEDCEVHRFQGKFGYHDGVVRDVRCEDIFPETGSLLMINSRFFHRVGASGCSRRTFSFSFGLTTNTHAVVWS